LLAIDSKPPSAEAKIALGAVEAKVVFPLQGFPYTRALILWLCGEYFCICIIKKG
jgi:hypothetical protein